MDVGSHSQIFENCAAFAPTSTARRSNGRRASIAQFVSGSARRKPIIGCRGCAAVPVAIVANQQSPRATDGSQACARRALDEVDGRRGAPRWEPETAFSSSGRPSWGFTAGERPISPARSPDLTVRTNTRARGEPRLPSSRRVLAGGGPSGIESVSVDAARSTSRSSAWAVRLDSRVGPSAAAP
jgi:hypothetical protein